MLLIDCPHCGPRDEVEFHYGGQAHVPYPVDPYALSDRAWAEFLFYRDNPRGPFAERWVHAVGCRKWFNAIRDTVTYEFLAVYPMGSPPPNTSTASPPAHDSAHDSGSDPS
ncbi:sarcosine oxidase subunit delta [Brevibacterium jeotgali]|uniref:Sarcosine oxidase subunit delta n=1 Tax=Brevibacterium jeotgali TaxID=1262550 RepID=A0A2H1L2V0_9MICO|nr:sarcosine oxidase subunit delta [Brevibacterium jeotgali]TWC01906.1 sarcosine oxidase subunit delta [Brevibacterium jeotgali]SMY10743.1 sarcosine oxidase subunit delta [Brevibacterium jeotgali]